MQELGLRGGESVRMNDAERLAGSIEEKNQQQTADTKKSGGCNKN